MQRDTGTRTGSPAPELWRTIFTLWGKDLPQAILLVCMQADSWGKPMTRCLPVSHNVVLSDCTLVLRIGCSLKLNAAPTLASVLCWRARISVLSQWHQVFKGTYSHNH